MKFLRIYEFQLEAGRVLDINVVKVSDSLLEILAQFSVNWSSLRWEVSLRTFIAEQQQHWDCYQVLLHKSWKATIRPTCELSSVERQQLRAIGNSKRWSTNGARSWKIKKGYSWIRQLRSMPGTGCWLRMEKRLVSFIESSTSSYSVPKAHS